MLTLICWYTLFGRKNIVEYVSTYFLLHSGKTISRQEHPICIGIHKKNGPDTNHPISHTL